MSAPLDRAADRLVSAVLAAALASSRPSVSSGTVIKVQPGQGANNTPLVTVMWQGAEIVVPHGGAYQPNVGDQVSLLRPDGPQLIINDKIIGGPRSA